MDNPTHLATGYFMSRAGLNRVTPYATPILLLSANIPDLDIVALSGGWVTYLDWHRSWTHTFLLSPVMALASVGIVYLFVRRPIPFMAATMVAWLGVISHLLLDWTNQYGIRFLLPFSPGWYQLDIATLFDICIYSGFAVCLFAPLLARLVSGEIGAKRRRFAGQGWAIAALLFLVLYFAGRGVIHTRLVEILNARDYDDVSPVRVAAFPEPSSPFIWHGIAESPVAYHVYRLAVFGATFDPSAGRILYKPPMSAAIQAAEKTREFRIFEQFAQYPLWQAVPSSDVENGTQVDLIDLRFPFHCRALVDGENRVRKTQCPVYGW